MTVFWLVRMPSNRNIVLESCKITKETVMLEKMSMHHVLSMIVRKPCTCNGVNI